MADEKDTVVSTSFGPGFSTPEPAAPQSIPVTPQPTPTTPSGAVLTAAPAQPRAYHAGGGDSGNGRGGNRPGRVGRRSRPFRGMRPGAAQNAPVAASEGISGAKVMQYSTDARTDAAGGGSNDGGSGKRRGKRDRRMGMPRKKLPSQRKLQPTQLHEGKLGAPAGMENADTLKVMALGGLG